MTKLKEARDHIYKLEFRIADLTVENDKLRQFARKVWKGPHHTAIDATKCSALVDWVCSIIDEASTLES